MRALIVDGQNGHDIWPKTTAMMKDYLSIIALKDVLLMREETNVHGRKACRMVPAGEGMVDWTAVFTDLKRIRFAGPLSVHCEFEVPPEHFMQSVKREVEFFRAKMNEETKI